MIHQGDALAVLREMPAESVSCCVTSPPYWGLRDYGTAKWEGGDVDCEHSGVSRRCDAAGRNDKQSTQKGSSSDRVSRDCLKCGARRVDAQLGLERTPEEYVARMVEVFREVEGIESNGELLPTKPNMLARMRELEQQLADHKRWLDEIVTMFLRKQHRGFAYTPQTLASEIGEKISGLEQQLAEARRLIESASHVRAEAWDAEARKFLEETK